MDNSFKQLSLISIVLLINLWQDLELTLFHWEVSDFLYTQWTLLHLIQIIALIYVVFLSFTNLKSKEPSNKLRNYLYIALSFALSVPTINAIFFFLTLNT